MAVKMSLPSDTATPNPRICPEEIINCVNKNARTLRILSQNLLIIVGGRGDEKDLNI